MGSVEPLCFRRCDVNGWDVSRMMERFFENAVMRSFEDRALHGQCITENEARRRVQICERIWKVLRIEKKWSLQRACDHLYHFLINELDGIQWEPDTRTIWVPD